MIAYPFGRAVGRIVRTEQGLPGDGGTPVYVPIPSARVTFHANIPERIRQVLLLTDPSSLLVNDFTVGTDADGRIVNGKGEPWQEVPTSVDPELHYSEWTWRITVTTSIVPPVSFDTVIPPYTGPGSEWDISLAARVPADPRKALTEWESLSMRVQGTVLLVQDATRAALDEIDQAGAGVESRAVAAATQAAATYTAAAGASATAAANSATAAAGSVTSAAGQVTDAKSQADRAKTEADRAVAAANTIDTTVLEQRIAEKADKSYVDNKAATALSAAKAYTDGKLTRARTRRTKTEVQPIDPNTWTTVTWGADAASRGITESGGTFTVQEPGEYLVICQAAFPKAATLDTAQRVIRLRQGSSLVVAQSHQRVPTDTAFPILLNVQTVVTLGLNDTLTLDARQGTAAALDLGGAAEQTFLSITRVG